jgi:hypothetical protein
LFGAKNLLRKVDMRYSLFLAMAGSLVCSTAGAADWSDTSVGYRYVSAQSEPGVTDKVAKNVLNFTHVSGDKMGTNFFTIDLLKSGTKDPNNGGAAGAQEWYGFYKRSFSLNAMTSSKGFGFAKDLSLTARIDAGAKNTTFAPAPLKLRLGVAAAMPVSAGFWDVGIELYKENNNNGITKKSVSFDVVPALSTAWSIPIGPGAFNGFADLVAPKGKDGFGDDTKTEFLARGTYMFDIGGSKSGFKAGVGLEFWNNKFGCNNSKSPVKNSCKATTPMVLAEYHF